MRTIIERHGHGPETAMTKVLIADDHALVRAGLKQFLQDSGLFSEISEAASGAQVIDRLREDPASTC